MKAIRLQRFRAFADTHFVHLRPLTVLVGRNSSGKSSFLRFLPLLRQSIESHTTGPIQWYGKYVDFGGFQETLSDFSEHDAIRVAFQLQLEAQPLRRTVRDRRGLIMILHNQVDLLSSTQCELTLAISSDPKDNSVTRFQSIEIEMAGHRIDIRLNGSSHPIVISINDREPFGNDYKALHVGSGRLLPLLYRPLKLPGSVAAELPNLDRHFAQPLALLELVDLLRPLLDDTLAESEIFRIASELPLGTENEMISHLRDLSGIGKLSGAQRGQIRNLIVANRLGDLLRELDQQLMAFATGVRYVKPVRATAERYYRQQDVGVDEVDPEGRNLATFLRSLTDSERRNFREWTFDQFGWKIRTPLAGGHLSLRIHKGRAKHNLTDVGFGFSQVLPVLVQLWFMQRRPPLGDARYGQQLTFVIEQPELHLHPSLQAQLADLLIRAIEAAQEVGVTLTIIVETHSEAIVNRVGQQIADGDLDPERAAVVLFEQDANTGESSVTTSDFDSDGFLRDWPFGFFEPE
ncbi:AAA family ATPase [Candidatus Palauibacter sp.]|uniref:AAA family ATPase n=1 Tax=Candidatus Palauibacter sp. TaxID=3101350 RepID=UPI003B028315